MLAVLAPERVMVADPRTGRAREREVPGGTLCHGPVLAFGDRAVYAGGRGGKPVALSLPLDLRDRPRSLSRADVMTASTAPGRIWLGRWTRQTPRDAAVALREVDATGRAGEPIAAQLPRWAWIAGVVDGAPLVQDDEGLPGRARSRSGPAVP